MKKLAIITLFVFSLFKVNAQVIITLGTGTVQNTSTTYPAPYGNWYWGAKHQIIIPASELYTAGIPGNIISALAFDVATPQGVALQNLEILMGHTTQSSLTTWETGLTSVYTAGSYTEVAGWNNHVFGTQFVWNGVDNIVIETCFNNSSYTNNAIVNQSTTSYNSTLYYNGDNATVCTNPAFINTSTQRPNMQLSVIPASSSDIDLGVVGIFSPLDGCGLSASSVVSVNIINFGNNDTSNVNVSYMVDGGSLITELITTTIPSHTAYTHTFSTNASLTGSSHVITAYTSLAEDTVLSNDTFTITVTDQSLTLPFEETFETLNDENYAPWSNGWTGDGSGFRWESESGISGFAGPDMDHTTMIQDSGIYMYAEVIGGGTGDSALMMSPCVDLRTTTNPALTFWYHKFGSVMGDLFIDVYSYTSGNWTRNIDQIIGQTHTGNASVDPWVARGVDLSSFNGEIISVRFRAVSAGCCEGHMAIDDVKFWEPAPVTANFVASTYSPGYQEVVNFTDLSTSDPNSWLWNFGDGNYSSDQHPSHSYNFPGSKTVTLIASNGPWTDTTVQSLIVQDPPLRFSQDSLFLSIPCGDSVVASVTFYNDTSTSLGFEIITDLDLPLDSVLSRVNRRYTDITTLVPSLYLFTDGVTGDNISDGGNDMYDGGNRLNTDFSGTSNIQYSDNMIISSADFGTTGQYFTRKVPGLFVMAADLDNVSLFNITGNLGADGTGNSDGAVLTSNLNGSTFTGFVNRTFNANDPSINRLIIVKDNPSATHTFLTSTNDEDHEVTGLNTSKRIYYLLFAGQGGNYISDADIQNIMDEFVSWLDAPSYLTISPLSDTIAGNDSTIVNLTFNPSGLNSGIYESIVTINNTTPPYATYYLYTSIDVFGAANMGLSATCLNYGSSVVNLTLTDTLEIYNSGCDTLDISSITSNNSDYVVSGISSNSIPPGVTSYVLVDFSPTSLGSSNGTLLIQSNLSDTTICLTGSGSNIVSNFTVSGQNPCSAQFQFNEDAIGAPTSWFWDFGDGNTSSSENPLHLYSSTGSYLVSLIVCNSSGCDTSDMVVTSNFTLDYSISTSGVLAPGNSISFTATGNNIISSSWNFGDGSSLPGMIVNHTYADTGTYIVSSSIITSDPCTFTIYDTVVITNNVGFNKINNLDISIYPNPSLGQFNLSLNGSSELFDLQVYNSVGKRIYINEGIALNNYMLDLNEQSGIYLIRVSRGGDPVFEKSIVISK